MDTVDRLVYPNITIPPDDVTFWSPLESSKGFIEHDRQTDILEYYNLSKWCKELKLFGRLIFYKKIICHIVQGSDLNLCQKFIQYSKTKNIDIDSKGKKCKERMLKILYQNTNNNDNKIPQLYNNWKVLKCQNTKQFLECSCNDKIIWSVLNSFFSIKK